MPRSRARSSIQRAIPPSFGADELADLAAGGARRPPRAPRATSARRADPSTGSRKASALPGATAASVGEQRLAVGLRPEQRRRVLDDDERPAPEERGGGDPLARSPRPAWRRRWCASGRAARPPGPATRRASASAARLEAVPVVTPVVAERSWRGGSPGGPPRSRRTERRAGPGQPAHLIRGDHGGRAHAALQPVRTLADGRDVLGRPAVRRRRACDRPCCRACGYRRRPASGPRRCSRTPPGSGAASRRTGRPSTRGAGRPACPRRRRRAPRGCRCASQRVGGVRRRASRVTGWHGDRRPELRVAVRARARRRSPSPWASAAAGSSAGRTLSTSWRSAAASTSRAVDRASRAAAIRAASQPATSATARAWRRCHGGGSSERRRAAASTRAGNGHRADDTGARAVGSGRCRPETASGRRPGRCRDRGRGCRRRLLALAGRAGRRRTRPARCGPRCRRAVERHVDASRRGPSGTGVRRRRRAGPSVAGAGCP